ncbi:RnfH family protein [Francisella philomiragia]|uniref:RnfH family protein n=1 Tax=Francisella philomiragia TaxID=28110 RepID=UPI0019037813|nr:RnfH family protein [Francisella philomiragia]MBK2255896.1 RnfH family protein [Francisella philomiragia]MBK2268554.1 RnfH family protein [Francisella philomiragia]MBK2270971.1 RnfH family protein [Francisella philomiragia]MBK2274751.1 RnfH family protein [Francisella philomiragia]MBK2294345.1 RnfH family protein [Francisella philomiragia]
MKVEVIYALPNEQKSFYVESDDSLTVREAIIQSKILDAYSELGNIENLKVGIYGQMVDLDHVLEDKDRVEIYRNLTIDPKQARMLRAEQKRKREGIRGFGA